MHVVLTMCESRYPSQQFCDWAMCVQPELHGMIPVSQGSFQALQQDAVQWPNSLKQSAAVCNSLNFVNKSQLVGDVADFAAFRLCEARFSVSSLYYLSCRDFCTALQMFVQCDLQLAWVMRILLDHKNVALC